MYKATDEAFHKEKGVYYDQFTINKVLEQNNRMLASAFES